MPPNYTKTLNCFFDRLLRVFIPFLSTALLIGGLAACQSGFSTTEPVRATTLPTSTPIASRTPEATLTPLPSPIPIATQLPHLQVNAQDLQDVIITFWHPWNGETAKRLDQIVDEFNQVNVWGIHVKARGFSSQTVLYKQLRNESPDSPVPDLVAAPLDHLLNLHQQHPLVNLNSYVASQQWGMPAKDTEDFFLNIWAQDDVNGYRYGVPAQREIYLLFYNQTWAQELGFTTPPLSTTQFQEQTCAAMQANLRTQRMGKIGTGGWLVDYDPVVMLSWLSAFATEEASKNQSQGLIYNTPASATSLEYMDNLYQKGCFWLGKNTSPYEYFSNRQALMISSNLSGISTLTDLLKHNKNNDQWKAIAYPSVDEKGLAFMDGPSYAVLYSSPEQQMASWLFIRWLVIARHQARLVESNLSLPVTQSALDNLQALAQKYPQWAQAAALLPTAQSLPANVAWKAASPVLSDLGWQVFHQPPTPFPPPLLLQQVDETIKDIQGHHSP